MARCPNVNNGVALLKSLKTGEAAPVEVISPDRSIQHNPQAGIGLSDDTLRDVLREGNFVLVVREGQINGQPTVSYDMFRIEGGKFRQGRNGQVRGSRRPAIYPWGA